MKLKEFLLDNKKKNALIGLLMLTAFFILLPTFVKVIGWQMSPYNENEVVITTVSYHSEGPTEGGFNLIVGNLFQPLFKFTEEQYPAIIACHGFLFGVGKESMNRWCVELAKRGFVVLSLDLPGNGMSIGNLDLIPRKDYESVIIRDGITFLKSLDFVNDSSIGLIGISYGGGVVSMCAGELGGLVDATISLNGFTNLTDWLIAEKGILKGAGITFSVTQEHITLEKVGTTIVTKDNIQDILMLFGVIKGDSSDFNGLIVPESNNLSRTFLRNFDAVDNLPNAKNDSVLFIHSQQDGTFGYTNQSGQGYDAITAAGNKAYYIPIDDNHQLMGNSSYPSDYCIINFFEEKLKGVDIGMDGASDLAKYSQTRDIVLTYTLNFSFILFYECLIIFFIALIPAFLVISIIVYNKQTVTKRARKEEDILNRKEQDPDFIDMSFGRGSTARTIIFLALQYLLAITLMLGIGLGFFHDLIAGMLCATFYFSMFMALYYLPDQAELELWTRLQGGTYNNLSINRNKETKVFDINSWIILGVVIAIAVIGAVVGSLFSTMPPFFKEPIETILIPMLIMGVIFVVLGILYIFFIEKKENDGISFNQIPWNRYTLNRYGILKSIVYGSALFLNFFVQYNIFAFYMKFPMIMGPHSPFYAIMIIAVILFFGGVQILIKILKEKFLLDNIDIPENSLGKKILVEVITGIIGTLLYAGVIYFAFAPLLADTLFGNLAIYLALLFGGIYLITSIIKLFCADKGVFGVSAFFPLLIIAILGFLLHI